MRFFKFVLQNRTYTMFCYSIKSELELSYIGLEVDFTFYGKYRIYI